GRAPGGRWPTPVRGRAGAGAGRHGRVEPSPAAPRRTARTVRGGRPPAGPSSRRGGASQLGGHDLEVEALATDAAVEVEQGGDDGDEGGRDQRGQDRAQCQQGPPPTQPDEEGGRLRATPRTPPSTAARKAGREATPKDAEAGG